MQNPCADAHWSGLRTLDDVPDIALEEFIRHANECPYHQAVLHEEERPLLKEARLAGSLFCDGRVPITLTRSDELENLNQLYERWRNGPAVPVKSLALRYCGEEVARHERVMEIIGARVVKELRAQGAFQIWKLEDEVSQEKVLLGTYLLDDFSHTGTPRYLSLPSGQQIMICVKQLHGDIYEIAFACARRKELDRFLAQLQKDWAPVTEIGRAVSARGARDHFRGFSHFDPPSASPWYHLPTPELAAMVVTAVFLFVCLLPFIGHDSVSKQQPAGRLRKSASAPAAAPPLSPPPTSQPSLDDVTLRARVGYNVDGFAFGKDGGAARNQRAQQHQQRPQAPDSDVIATVDSELALNDIVLTTTLQPKGIVKSPETGNVSASVYRLTGNVSASVYYLFDGSKYQPKWVRAGDDEVTGHSLISALKGLGAEAVTNMPAKESNMRIVNYRFIQDNKGITVTAQVSDAGLTFLLDVDASLSKKIETLDGMVTNYLDSQQAASSVRKTINTAVQSGAKQQQYVPVSVEQNGIISLSKPRVTKPRMSDTSDYPMPESLRGGARPRQ